MSNEAKDIFISYARKDLEKVEPIVAELILNGYSLWHDIRDVNPGDLYSGEIVRGIRNCQVFLVLVSASAFKSEYVIKELGLANSHKKHIVPLNLETLSFPGDFPDEWQLIMQGVNSHDISQIELEKLLSTIVDILTGLGYPPKPIAIPHKTGDLEDIGFELFKSRIIKKIAVHDEVGARKWLKRLLNLKSNSPEALAMKEWGTNYVTEGLKTYSPVQVITQYVTKPKHKSKIQLSDVEKEIEKARSNGGYHLAEYRLRLQQYRFEHQDLVVEEKLNFLRETIVDLTSEISDIEGGLAKSMKKDHPEMVFVGTNFLKVAPDIFEQGEDGTPQSGFALMEWLFTGFAIDQFPVTNAEYRHFMDVAHNHPEDAPEPHKLEPMDHTLEPLGWEMVGANDDNRPVVGVSWFAARAYAKWKGKRLPSEAEWLGSVILRIKKLATANGGPGERSESSLVKLAPGKWEWTADWWSATAGGKREDQDQDRREHKRVALNPRGHTWGDTRAIMKSGGKSKINRSRAFPLQQNNDCGFRCAKSLYPEVDALFHETV